MRLFLFHFILVLAGLVSAQANAFSDARARGHAVDAVEDSHLDKRWCFLFICFGSTSTSTTTTTTSTKVSTSTAKSTSSAAPTATPSPAQTSATASAQPTPSAQASATASSQPSVTPSVSTSVAPSQTSAPASSAGGGSSAFEQTVTTWSYPQHPLPPQSYGTPDPYHTASVGAWSQYSPKTRAYNFDITYAAGAPSGFHRRMAVINNQYPAPLIEAYQGDTLVITVNNHLDIPQAIHWHGMRQNGTNWADGVPGISQCGIPPGSSFTYRFKLDTEVGTYWYHSHYSNTMADGITGGLIVYANNQPYRRGRDYDAERVLYLNDWMNDDSEIIAQGLLDLSKGYRGSAIPPDPDAVLINGLGQSDCDVAQLGVKCISQKPYVMKANYGNKVRLRLINMGSHAVLRFSIDNHELQLIEIDDTSIQAINVHEVTLAPGQRASVIVRLNRGNIGSAFWMRATTASGCMNPLHVITTKAILWYSSFFGTLWSSGIPNTQPWGDLADAAYAPCRDTDEEHTVIPMEKEDSPATAIQAGMMDSSFGRFVHPDGTPFIGFGYNEVSFINYINNPLLSQVEKGSQLNPKHVASLTFNSPSNKHAIDFIVNNLDPVGLTHPFHLHGRPFHIIHRGKGKLTPDMISSLTLNTANPPRRDTLTIGGGEHVLLRIITDTPGVWPIHCHIGWHLATGKLGVFVIRPDVVATFTQPAEWSNLCNGLDPNEIGPARRTLPPQSRANSWSDEPEEYAGGVQDFTPTPEGASRREYRANGTHWWVDGTEYAGEIAGEHQSPDKRGLLEARTVFMNATDWWIPGTVFHGKLETPINVEEQAATAFKSEEDSNLVIVTPDLIVPGPGDALVENTEIINGTLVETEVTTFENLVPVGYTAAAPDPKETGKSAL